jgi:hypothetical protein
MMIFSERVRVWLGFGIVCLCLQSMNGAEQQKSGGIRTIAKGAFSAIQEPMELVITNKTQWEEIWKKQSKRIPPEPAPAIDFDKETVLFVSMGRKNTGGYGISIESVRKADSGVVAKVLKKSPAPGAMTIQSLTAPFHIVAIPKGDGKVKFEIVEDAGKKEKQVQ